MGEPKFSRPKFDTPPHPWKKARIEEEHLIQANHGLKNMREIWKAKSQLRRHRRQAMRLIGTLDTSEGHGMREKDDLLRSLHLKGFIAKDAILDDILSLNAEAILNRRLQAMVYYKGLACSLKQARQLVTHGHICIGDQEEIIQYHPSSDLNNPEHEIRKAIDGRRELAEYAEEEVDPEATKPFADEVNEAAETAPSAEAEVEGGGEA